MTRLTPAERLQHARTALVAAKSIEVPTRGRARVGPLARARSLLMHAHAEAIRVLRHRPRANDAERAEAEAILAELERYHHALWLANQEAKKGAEQ